MVSPRNESRGLLEVRPRPSPQPGEDVCSICLEPMLRGGAPTSSPPGCAHEFHAGCLALWERKQIASRLQLRCPLCQRTYAPPPPPPSTPTSRGEPTDVVLEMADAGGDGRGGPHGSLVVASVAGGFLFVVTMWLTYALWSVPVG